MIKGILFDYDGTLSARYIAAVRMYHHMIHMISSKEYDPLEEETMVQQIMMWDEFGTLNKRYVMDNMKKNYFPDMDAAYWTDYWYAHFDEVQVPMPGSREVLLELKKHYKLGILSNGESASQHAKITKLGLEDIFEQVIVSGDYQIDKPDVRIFQIAAERLGCSCEETAMVGDTFYRDITGAVRAGMYPVYYCYEKRCYTEYPVQQAADYNDIRHIFIDGKLWEN